MRIFTMRLATLSMAIALPGMAIAAGPVTVHRDPGCGCCENWARQVKAAFKRDLRMVDDADRLSLKARLGIPASLASCHTALIDGLAFEGHVPIADMKRALATRPGGVKGLAVAGMPLGSPGMEMAGRKQSYEVVNFGPGRSRVYARH